jgi:hypothetical protein
MTNDTTKLWMERVMDNPYDLELAPTELKESKEIAQAALCRPFEDYISFSDSGWYIRNLYLNLEVFQYLGPAIKRDNLFIQELMQCCSGFLFRHLDQDLKQDVNLFFYALRLATVDFVEKQLFQYLEESDKDEMELLDRLTFEDTLNQLTILKDSDNEETLPYLKDKEVMLKAVELQPAMYQHASIDLKNDKELSMKAVEAQFENFYFVPNPLNEDWDLIFSYLNGEKKEITDYGRDRMVYGIYWDQIGEKTKNNIEFYYELIKRFKDLNLSPILGKAPEHIKQDELINQYLSK